MRLISSTTNALVICLFLISCKEEEAAQQFKQADFIGLWNVQSVLPSPDEAICQYNFTAAEYSEIYCGPSQISFGDSYIFDGVTRLTIPYLFGTRYFEIKSLASNKMVLERFQDGIREVTVTLAR